MDPVTWSYLSSWIPAFVGMTCLRVLRIYLKFELGQWVDVIILLKIHVFRFSKRFKVRANLFRSDELVWIFYAFYSSKFYCDEFIFSLIFSLLYATIAAKSELTEEIFVRLLDIFQSVPMLGHSSLTVTGFLMFFPIVLWRVSVPQFLPFLHLKHGIIL